MESLNSKALPVQLTVLDALPQGFLELEAAELHTALPGPSLIHLRGEREPPLFVSVLLHGNETTGLSAMQQLLTAHERTGRALPRSLLLFVGNVSAAAQGLRRLDDQPDYNRIWEAGPTPEHEMARAVIDYARSSGVFAAIDVHNNTGRNPFYACINRLEPRAINLARQFKPTIVYFTEPHQVIARAFSRLCPSITLECGMAGEPVGIEYVREFLEHCLCLDGIDATPPDEDVDIFQTVARVTVPADCSIGFGDSGADFCFPEDFDELNFHLLPHDSCLGRYNRKGARLIVKNNNGEDVSDEYLYYVEGRIISRKAFLPSMFTKNVRVIYQDCLGYIMEFCRWQFR